MSNPPNLRETLRGKPWGYILGTCRYWQQQGQGYAEMFKGSLTAGGIVTAGAAWLGMGKVGALLLGVSSVFFWQILATFFGWLAWRHKIIENQLGQEWKNNPWQREVVGLLATLVLLLKPRGKP